MEYNKESFKKALKECGIIRWENHFEKVVKSYLKAEQLTISGVSNSCGLGDTSILIKGLEDISNWDDEQEEWHDDPGHCANMTLIKYYNSKK
jgi:hypothetical protein